jgi:hypothetical protein
VSCFWRLKLFVLFVWETDTTIAERVGRNTGVLDHGRGVLDALSDRLPLSRLRQLCDQAVHVGDGDLVDAAGSEDWEYAGEGDAM